MGVEYAAEFNRRHQAGDIPGRERQCAGCGTPIREGDETVAADDGTVRHAYCEGTS